MSKKFNYGLAAGWVSIIGNILLFAVKYWVGIISNSIALIADAYHTLSDSVSSIVVLLGFKIAGKEKNHKRPFGYGRAELIASVIVGTLLGVVAVEFFIESIDKINSKETTNYGFWAILITASAILVKELMAQFSFFASKKSNSKSLRADAWHHRSDAISSLVILVGIFFGDKLWWIDSALGIAVSILIAYTSFEIIKDSSDQLIGNKPNKKIVDQIRSFSKELFKQDMDIHHIHSHAYGDHVEITFHMVFDSNTSVQVAHDKATLLENKIFDELGIYATIHMEPENQIDNIS